MASNKKEYKAFEPVKHKNNYKAKTIPDEEIPHEPRAHSYVDKETGEVIRKVVSYDWQARPVEITLVEPEIEALIHEAIYNATPYIEAYGIVFGVDVSDREIIYQKVSDILAKKSTQQRISEKWDAYKEERDSFNKWELQDATSALKKVVTKGLGTLNFRFTGGVAREVTNAVKELNEMLGFYDQNKLEKRKLELEIAKLERELKTGGTTQQIFIMTGEDEMRKALEDMNKGGEDDGKEQASNETPDTDGNANETSNTDPNGSEEGK